MSFIFPYRKTKLVQLALSSLVPLLPVIEKCLLGLHEHSLGTCQGAVCECVHACALVVSHFVEEVLSEC